MNQLKQNRVNYLNFLGCLSSAVMKIDHVVQALEGYVPAGLHGIQLKPPTDSRIGWEDVGGLDQPKKLLIEILKWPTQVYKLTYSINFFLESHCQLLFCS